jgi:hypothetical protein
LVRLCSKKIERRQLAGASKLYNYNNIAATFSSGSRNMNKRTEHAAISESSRRLIGIFLMRIQQPICSATWSRSKIRNKSLC